MGVGSVAKEYSSENGAPTATYVKEEQMMTVKELAQRYAEKPTEARYEVLEEEILRRKWNPIYDDGVVRKNLPEKSGEYLVTWTGVLTGFTKRTRPLVSIAEYEIHEFENYEDWITTEGDFEPYSDIKVLAWMPLVEPYKDLI